MKEKIKKLLLEDDEEYEIIFKDNNKFFNWIKENRDLIKNVKVSVNRKNIRVIYDKI